MLFIIKKNKQNSLMLHLYEYVLGVAYKKTKYNILLISIPRYGTTM